MLKIITLRVVPIHNYDIHVLYLCFWPCPAISPNDPHIRNKVVSNAMESQDIAILYNDLSLTSQNRKFLMPLKTDFYSCNNKDLCTMSNSIVSISVHVLPFDTLNMMHCKSMFRSCSCHLLFSPFFMFGYLCCSPLETLSKV